jgi:hypothetical protein
MSHEFQNMIEVRHARIVFWDSRLTTHDSRCAAEPPMTLTSGSWVAAPPR